MKRPKPHIYRQRYASGYYWRVTLMPKPYNPADQPLWSKAHEWAARKNTALSIKNFQAIADAKAAKRAQHVTAQKEASQPAT